MQNFLVRFFKLPVGEGAKALMFERVSAGRTPEGTLDFIMDAVQHHTHKSGALLGAQGIFVVVSTYAMDHGWPKGAVLAAIFMLLLGSLMIMSTLLSTGKIFLNDPSLYGRRAFDLLMGRIIRFNIALYLTFLSVVLLAVGTIALI